MDIKTARFARAVSTTQLHTIFKRNDILHGNLKIYLKGINIIAIFSYGNKEENFCNYLKNCFILKVIIQNMNKEFTMLLNYFSLMGYVIINSVPQ